jgi:hypothetical protein
MNMQILSSVSYDWQIMWSWINRKPIQQIGLFDHATHEFCASYSILQLIQRTVNHTSIASREIIVFFFQKVRRSEG